MDNHNFIIIEIIEKKDSSSTFLKSLTNVWYN